MTEQTLGTCYYPEHWPEDIWADDAVRMVEAGLTWIRIGEFAWSRMEPTPGVFDWGWLDRAIETLGAHGLKVVLGTPTATPPRWMLDKLPDMLAHDSEGRARKFGSRRHYCFSHEGYRAECRRITRALAERYGKNPHVAAWQTDNEYDCHDTVISYSAAARVAFQNWLAQRYQSPNALNKAWGNVFWSMDYDDFAQIDLPNLTVTEPNPAHVLAFRRFSSDMVVDFNRIQVDEIRAHTDAPIIHNYMGRITSFDHYKVGADLDIASWDSYPLGFLMDRMEDGPDHKAAFVRQGDPDFQAFHHDLYRSVGAARTGGDPDKGRWWVMEQQPGPVNWAPWNPSPLKGMVRLWALEAFAHGAETVCYFRWRQAPFAQEQMHAGLLYPDSSDAPGLQECKQVAEDLATLGGLCPADVALVFDYDSAFMWEAQPQGQDFDYFRLTFETYRALRRAGLNIDIVPPSADLARYKAVFAPGLAVKHDLSSATGPVIIGPRAFAKTEELSIPVPLPPNLDGITAPQVESLPPSLSLHVQGGGKITRWVDRLTASDPVWMSEDGSPVLARAGMQKGAGTAGSLYYLAGWLDGEGMERLITEVAGLPNAALPDGLRLRKTTGGAVAFNYAATDVSWNGATYAPASATLLT